MANTILSANNQVCGRENQVEKLPANSSAADTNPIMGGGGKTYPQYILWAKEDNPTSQGEVCPPFIPTTIGRIG